MGNDFIFNRNYNDLQELVLVVCKECRVDVNSDVYPTILAKCTKYFWGNLTQPEFRQEIENIKAKVGKGFVV